MLDEWCIQMRKRIIKSVVSNFKIFKEVLRFIDCVYVPKVSDFRYKILSKAHNFFYITYFRDVKMYQDLETTFWWISMKKVMVDFVARCLVCLQV